MIFIENECWNYYEETLHRIHRHWVKAVESIGAGPNDGKNIYDYVLSPYEIKKDELVPELKIKMNRTYIPNGIFNNLEDLGKLDIETLEDQYDLPFTVAEHVFDNLANLKELHQSFKVNELPDHLFDKLNNLKVLTIRVKRLPSQIFDKLQKLEGLGVYFVEEFPEDIFGKLGNLKGLGFFSNNLSTFPENLFSNLPNLTKLTIAWCKKLTELPEHIFDGLHNLKELHLNTNSLQSLPEHIFNKLGNLKKLHLHENSLTELPEHIFDQLGNLEELELRNNKFTQLPDRIFEHQENLRDLSINNNPLVDIPLSIAALEKIKWLHIGRGNTLPRKLRMLLSSRFSESNKEKYDQIMEPYTKKWERLKNKNQYLLNS